MAEVAYILLCHKDPEGIIAQVERLVAAGDFVALHFDGRAADADFARLRQALGGNPSVAFATKRIKCGWGEWSLVAATLEALRAAEKTFPQASHFYMLSGDCMPIKSGAFVHDFLDRNPVDFVESFDFFKSDWIKTGLRGERLTYRHFFNERHRKWLFYASMDLQRRLGMQRQVPRGLAIQIGSQWWCLRRETVEKLLELVATRPDVIRFFRTTWIPDETFFQTLVRHLVPDREIMPRTLTFLMFTDYGMPLTFYNDHYDFLVSQDYLFARKISPEAVSLTARLGALYNSGETGIAVTDEGRNLFKFLTGRGRVGRRFGPRIWNKEATIGRERSLLILTCKKWHVAKRLAARITEVTGIRHVDYLFDEAETALPDLGGIGSTLAKRGRHRRAVMRLVLEGLETDRLAFCVDPVNRDMLLDFQADGVQVRVLEIICDFTDEYLAGHARRLKLATPKTSAEAMRALLPVLRHDIAHESEQIAAAGLTGFSRLREAADTRENAVALAEFLGIPLAQAAEIADTPHLFTD
jgi:Family of unknown function (DUF5928)/Core-2/I-Branching enzyme